MRNILIVLLTVSFLFSCKKDKTVVPNNNTTPVSALDYFKLDVGNYWVYETSYFGSTKIDSTTIARDSIIGGNSYRVLEGHNFIGNWAVLGLLRDSSNYIVNEIGVVQFALNNFSDTLNELHTVNGPTDSIVSIYYTMIQELGAITVPAGTFDSILNYQGEMHPHINGPNAPLKYDDNCYSKGIGLVKSITNFAHGTDKIEKRLLRYYVQ